MKKKDFIQRRDRMNRVLLSNSASVVSSWLEGEKIGKEYVAINPLRDDETLGSFNINLTTGVWKDFADDDFTGPDLVSLYMRLNGLDESAALDALVAAQPSGPKSIPPALKQPTEYVKAEVLSAPAPDDCHLPPDIHSDLGAPSWTWEYRTAEGRIAFLVYRFDTEKGKETRPVSYNPEKQDWQWKLPNSPLPIYHLDLLTSDTDASVLVVEGEKAADAATKLFPDHISSTSASGSSNALKADWSPLHQRSVTLIPDADEPGTKYAMTVAAELMVYGSEVFVIDTLKLGWSGGEDVADYPDLTQEWLTDERVLIADWAYFADMDGFIIEAAARMPPLDYDRRKDKLVELLGGVAKPTLDGMVKQARKAHAQADKEVPEATSIFADEEPWPQAVDGKALVTEIQAIVRNHVILSEHEALAVALWIVQTYVFSAFRVCPRLLVSSPEKRCGKTTLLETIQALCFRGLAAANISAASLFRAIEAWSPTLLIDEADTFLHGNDELRGILNAGHTKSTAYVLRTAGDDHEPKRFYTFAPIAIGMIKQPPDTLLDRAVVIRLQRKLGIDPVIPLPLETEQEYLHIRQKCLRWADDTIEELAADRALTPADIDNDRARDNWIPLTAIAQSCGLLEAAQAACRQLTLKEEDSLTVELLADIRQIFEEENKDKLTSKFLVKKLTTLEERPWAEFSRGKPLNQNKLAKLLKDFGVHTVQAKLGSKNLKHYKLADLTPLFERYLKADALATPDRSTATPLPDAENPLPMGAAGVADEVAVTTALSDEGATQSNIDDPFQISDAGVADAKPLPLPSETLEAAPEQRLQPGSGVAGKKGVRR